MKKFTTHSIILLMAAFSLGSMALTGCSKDKTTTSAENYQINNITDQTIAQGSTATTAWEVKLSGGTQAQVSLAVTGLPAGIAATITPNTGIPTFTAIVTFAVNASVPAGTYAYTITATGSQGNKTYTSHIIVTAVPECATTLPGLYVNSNFSPADSIQVSLKSGYTDRINIAQIYNGNTDSAPFYAVVYCSQDSLDIPNQTFVDDLGNTSGISGHGSFSATGLKMTARVTFNGTVYDNPEEVFQKH